MKNATTEDPTDPLEPTKYPLSTDFLTSFCAIKYNTAKPFPIIELSSFSILSSRNSGNGFPYNSYALSYVMFLTSSSAPSISGG